ncbi:MAG: DUF975 family protein [Treponema sp.]|nr:DUF975 family protein [Treponema sp.]
MKKSAELRALARAQLKGTWLAAVVVCLVYSVILGLSSLIVVGSLVLGGPLALGYAGYFLKKSRGEPAKLEDLFDGFEQFGSAFLLGLLQFIFITLWFCLLIVPGIIKCFSYSMSFYIMKDNPNIGALEAITQSRKMMAGHKGRLFCLGLSFIGWGLLCCLTFGIGVLWLAPYISASVANFYVDLKSHHESLAAQ